MVHLDWTRRRVRRNAWKRIVEGQWGWHRARRHDKRLDTEAANELGAAYAVAVGFDVSLIPRHPERAVGLLDHEEIKVGIGRKSVHPHGHDFNRPAGDDADAPGGIGHTRRNAVQRGRPYHLERNSGITSSTSRVRRGDKPGQLYGTEHRNPYEPNSPF